MQPLVDKRTFLGAHPLFSRLSAEDLAELEKITTVENVSANKRLIKQGDQGEKMYVIAQGKVSVFLHIADKEDIPVGELSPGEAFGEIALFDQKPRTATVVSSEPCKLLVIHREQFRNFLLQHPHVALDLLAVMSTRLRSASNFFQTTLYDNVSSRLAEAISKIAGAYGRKTRKGVVIETSFDSVELGNITGLPKDVVSAQLHFWQDKGLLKIKRGCLTLLQPEEISALH